MTSEGAKKDLTVSNQQKVIHMLEKMKPEMAKAMPAHMTAERMARIILTEMRKTPKLLQCDPLTVVASTMVCSQLGVEVGVLGHAYLIPYWNKKKGVFECQFQLGYKGMIDLARRSGQIVSISAHCVYAKDTFEFEYGLEEKLKHVPSKEVSSKGGKFDYVYAVAKLVGGGHQFEVLTHADVEAVRKKSPGGNTGPWLDYYDEMARKTAIRRLFKYLPVSVEMQKAISYEENLESKDDTNVIDLAKEDFDVVDDFWSNLEAASKEDVAPPAAEQPAAAPNKTQADELAGMI